MNKCRWCEKEVDTRCSSCHTCGCEKCLRKHLEIKLVAEENYPDYIEKIPNEDRDLQ